MNVALPMRPFDESKSRLASILSSTERRALAEEIFCHVLAVAVRAAGTGKCFVVSRSAEVLDLARMSGAIAVEEAGVGLNMALEHVRSAARAAGAGYLLSLGCDLPFVSEDDLYAIRDAADENMMVIAPDEAGQGTNALLLPSSCSIAYRYGPDSCAMHTAAGRAIGMGVRLIDRDGLKHDIDTPEQLQDAWRRGWRPRA